MVCLITTVFSPLPETPSHPVWPLPLALCLSTSSLCTRSCWCQPRKCNHINYPQTLLSSSHITRSEIYHLHKGWPCIQPRTTNATNSQQQNKTIPTIPPPKVNKQTLSARAYSISKRRKRAFRTLNKTSQHPFRASINTFLKKKTEGNHQLWRHFICRSFPEQAGNPERNVIPYLLLLCWGPVYQLAIMLLGPLWAPPCRLVKWDQLLPYVLKCLCSLLHCSLTPHLHWWHHPIWVMDVAHSCSPHPDPKPAIVPSHCRPFWLSQLLKSILSHCLSEMLPGFSPSFHLNTFFTHYYTTKAFRKTFRKGLLGPPSVKLYYSFSVSFCLPKMPLAFDPGWGPWGGSICLPRTY